LILALPTKLSRKPNCGLVWANWRVITVHGSTVAFMRLRTTEKLEFEMRSIVMTMTVFSLFGGAALAATPQQERMKTCNVDAKSQELKGDARKTFMSGCLKGETAAAPEKSLTPQQEKMKTCNTDASAKSLKGKERSSFMSTCLKG
jgi:hypothetical protein